VAGRPQALLPHRRAREGRSKVLLAIIELIRRWLSRPRFRLLGAIASLAVGIYLEAPLLEQAAIHEARALTTAVIAAEQHALRQLEPRSVRAGPASTPNKEITR
jgi:hypothetical protein